MSKYKKEYVLSVPVGGVKLTGGRFLNAFEYNIAFLKKFDTDRILYWYRVYGGKPAPKAPYACGDGHFENNLHGQTAGTFLMGACTTLLWQEDAELREKARIILDGMKEFQAEDGFLVPIERENFNTKEYPNYTRAWITFGLLDAGYAGEEDAFVMARRFGDFFNQSSVLPYVKDLNLGFQGILANTRLYDSPVGKTDDMEIAEAYYKEDWWLDQLIADDHRAIYNHPGNHPHSTLLTTLEGYCDLYRATGNEKYLEAVKHALRMYESKWQHVGGGINMCEEDRFYPGCNWLSHKHHYNELCSTNFWVLLNQRMHLLEPDNPHYVDEMENSIYNVLFASQVGSTGFHYLNYLQGTKDWRYLDPATCCASLGTRLTGLLPQFLYTFTDTIVSCDIYADSEASLPNGVSLKTETDMPDGGHVTVTIIKAEKPFTLRLRIPRWASEDGLSRYEVHNNVKAGDVFTMDFPFRFRMTRYTGGEKIIGKERWAMEYGPLLYAVLGAPNPVAVSFDPSHPEKYFTPLSGKKREISINGDNCHIYRAYLDIDDEPFDVYPIVDR